MMKSTTPKTTISLMLAVPDTPAAVGWYQQALGAQLLWSLGSVAGLEIDGAPFFLHEPVKNKFASPKEIGITTVRVELFVDNPDEVIARAVKEGATGGAIEDHIVPWGTHRQGGFIDPFGHKWLVGDKSPLKRFPS
jgi:PhnB protein